jgi:hypothetical protein
LKLKPIPQPKDMTANYQKMVADQKAKAASTALQATQQAQATQVEQTPTPTPIIAYTAPTASIIGNSGLSDWLLRLRTCESGGNYAENTGNGYYGAYQFSIATWNHWNTGYARADLAPASVQDATIIENTLATAGLSTQNPGCYVKMGLSNYPPNS